MDKHQKLLENIKKNLPELEKLLKEINDHWVYEDKIYRFYHYSFKVYGIQEYTKAMVEILKKLSPDRKLDNEIFEEILKEGTEKRWKEEHNTRWTRETRPMIEAFLHAKFFLEMAIKYGKELNETPRLLPSGWAALLYLYGLR